MSVVLAIEWSTRRLSVATRHPEEAPRQSNLTVERFHGPDAVGLLENHLANAGLEVRDLSGILIGRGPGNFSGIRLAFAWAAGCMAPGNVSLRAFSSGRVMAERLLETCSAFWVLGDARRGFWWGCRVAGGIIQDWELETPDVWRERIGDGRAFSSEAARLNGLSGLEEAFPQALDLLNTPADGEPAQPLYLHPAV